LWPTHCNAILVSDERLPRLAPPFGAVVHAACDFNTDMGAIDRRLLDTLLPVLAAQREKPRFLYTGGCWLFGETGDQLATEETPFDPLPAFAWMVPNLQRVLAATRIDGVVIHPAMVYAENGGVFHRMYREAKAGEAVRVVGSDAIRWPLVHSEDLAALYALVLEHAPSGSSYIGAAIEGLPVGRIARAFASRFGSGPSQTQAVPASAIVSELGGWARGYALDQRLSGARARRELGWEPKHLDPEGEIAQIR
jgi:nucleoside-diphosphate-sugar epimerase